MAATPAGFVQLFPEFTSVDSGRIQFWLDFSVGLICTGMFKSNGDNAVYMLAAHYLYLSQKRVNAASGDSPESTSSVSSMSVGDVSTSFDNSKLNAYLSSTSKDAISQELAMTDYGRMYLSLLRRYGTIAMTTAQIGG